MGKEGYTNIDGLVLEALPSLRFRVRIDGTETEWFCYLSGKLNQNFIRILVGDRVTVAIPPTGNIARIIRRL